MKKIYCSFFILCLTFQVTLAQAILQADGPGNTYELINSVFAPGHDAVEDPDCSHNSFSRHIDEVFDNELNKYVFRFHMHVLPDTDRCINFDRQRNEIKTYDKSPDSLKAVRYEKVEYRWKFKLDSLFQPSAKFTHIYQIKAVGGSESSMPLMTLTPRKSSPDKLQLRYADALTQSTIAETSLVPFKGVWVQAKSVVLYDEVGLGQYELLLTKIVGGDTLFHYTNNAIRTWKTNASFLRPKWGIYRSLDDAASLRDEQVLFADFSIEELDTTVSMEAFDRIKQTITVYPNPAMDRVYFSEKVVRDFQYVHIYNSTGQLVTTANIEINTISFRGLSSGLYFLEFRGERRRSEVVKLVVRD